MKSILLTLALLIGFSPAAQAGLWDRIRTIKADDFDFGVVGGVSKGAMDNKSSVESADLLRSTAAEDELGFTAGGRVRYNFSDTFKFGLDLTYTQQKIKLTERDNSGFGTDFVNTTTLNYVNFKPHLTFVTNFGVALTGGFNFGFSAGADVETVKTELGVQTTANVSLNNAKSRIGLYAAVGYEWEVMGHTLVPELGFDFALNNTFSQNDVALISANTLARGSLDDTRLNAFYFQLAFLF